MARTARPSSFVTHVIATLIRWREHDEDGTASASSTEASRVPQAWRVGIVRSGRHVGSHANGGESHLVPTPSVPGRRSEALAVAVLDSLDQNMSTADGSHLPGQPPPRPALPEHASGPRQA